MAAPVDKAARFGQILDLLASICSLLSGLAMVALVSTFGWLVYGRYVLNSTPTWVEQLSMLLIITITFLSSASGVRERSHLCVDIVPMMCRPQQRVWLNLFCHFMLGGFGVLMALKATELSQFSWYKTIPLLDIPEGVRYLPVLVSGWLVALFSIGNIARELSNWRALNVTNNEPAKMAEE